jgi:Prokaryotic N-terminal methylation motif
MLTALSAQVRRRAAAQDGVTLIELVVAMACGLIVMIGATTIMITTMQQTQSTFTRIDATRQARTAFGNIENELHSACVNGDPPIQGVAADGTVESDNNDLVFLSYTGTAANPTPVWHRLSYSATAGTLTDTSYAATYNSSATADDWSQGSLISTNTLLTNLPTQSATPPIFQYFAYQSVGSDASGNVYYVIPDGSNVSPLTGAAVTKNALSTTGGLSAANANTAVEVVITLLVGPSGSNLTNSSLTSADDPVSDTISLRLTTPPDYAAGGSAAAQYAPCQ